VIGYIIKLDEPRSEGLAQPFHHASDAGNVVIGGTDEGEKAFGGVLSQKSHTWRPERQGLEAPAVRRGFFLLMHQILVSKTPEK
jgi:hypothetical protein